MTGPNAGAEWFMRPWTMTDGLPNDYVNAIVPAEDGYLWVGTQAGLSRFDGVRFTPLIFSDDDQLIYSLHPDLDGNLWVVLPHGTVICLKPDFSRVYLSNSDLPKEGLHDIVQDDKGALWFAYADSVCRLKDGKVTMLTTNDEIPNSTGPNRLVYDRSGHLWLSRDSAVAMLEGDHFKPITKLTRRVRMTADGRGGVWITAGAHLYQCNPAGKMRDCGTFVSAATRADVRALMADHTGAVWIGTDNSGLYRYSDAGFEKIETSQSSVLSLAEDKEGNIWAGTAGGGLDRITRRGIWLEGMDDGSGSLIPLQSICEDAGKTVWGVTQNGLLVTRTNGQWLRALTNIIPAVGVITCVAADKKGSLWIGTRDRRLYRWFKDELTDFDADKGFGSHTVINLFADSKGDIWICEYGSPQAFQYVHNGELQNVTFPPRFRGRINAVAEDVNHNIWIGTSDGALCRVKGNRLLKESSLSPSATNRPILCLHPTSDGALWIGYDGGGLGRLKDGRFNRLTADDGLFDNRISQIIADDEGWLWLGSGKGIFKVRRPKLENAMENGGSVQCIHYGPNEGLFSTEANSANVSPYIAPTALHSSEGRIWIPMRSAVAVIDPGVFNSDSGPPPVLLTGMIVDGQIKASYLNTTETATIAGLKVMKTAPQLSPSHHRLDFQFAAVNFSAPENMHLQYKLDGLDPAWIDAGERHAEYSRLAAGKYAFRIRARNGDGDWNESKAPLEFTVIPFVWQTWWFRLLAILGLVSLVAAIVRYVSFRRLRAKLQRLEQEAALNRERARIARDIHDDLGGNLTQVKQLFELTSRHRASPEQVHEFVQRGLAVTRQGVKSLDETVWAVNPRNDTLPDLINYIGQRTVEFLSTAGIRYHLDLPDHPPSRPVPAEVRHNLFFVVKESLNNIVCHAHASEVWLKIISDDDAFHLSLQDDGCGFENLPDNPCADGLRNMHQRMEMINGQCRIDSAPEKGTRIEVAYPWPR